MGLDETTALTPELLNDFYAECEEHLNIVRQSLVILEAEEDEQRRLRLIEKLYRSFHSLKGIFGMAGIRSAEELTHRTEDYVRELSQGKLTLNPEGLDLLAHSVQLTEQSVAAFRDKQPYPDVTGISQKVAALVAAAAPHEKETEPSPSQSLSDAIQSRVELARSQGHFVLKARFIPSPQLNERGINVNSVRARLSELGEIIQAAPHIGSGGNIAFEFFVALREPPDLTSWTNVGVTLSQIAQPSTAQTAPPAPVSGTSSHLAVSPSQVIRVELQRLDDLMRIAGELVIQRSRLEAQIDRLALDSSADVRGLQEVNHGFARQFRNLRETVMRLRMVPIAEIFDRMPFVVRDLIRGSGKKIRLEMEGQQTELDKYVVERLKDPLLHLVRNAVSHGIEDAEERTASGKPAEAVLSLTASTAGETVVIEIGDDGKGINPVRLKERADEMGLPVPEPLDAAGILELISLHGFSTREEADRASGRGVGMAAVANTLRELGGVLTLGTDVGKGTRFTLRLPLTLLITEALILSCGGESYAVPQNSIDEVVPMDESSARRVERAELVSLRGTALPLIRLRALFGFPPAKQHNAVILVFQTDRGRMGLVVDRILGQKQIVVRSVQDPLIHVAGVIGATEMGDGKPLLILDPSSLAKEYGTRRVGINRGTRGNDRKERIYDAAHPRNGVLHPV